MSRYTKDIFISWDELHRDNNIEDKGAQLFGIFSAADYPKSTLNGDVVYVFNADDGNDGIHWGISSVQRLGHTNSTFRLLGSHALDQETAAVRDGYLLFSELSWDLPWSHDLVYFNAFWGIDRFASGRTVPPGAGIALLCVSLLLRHRRAPDALVCKSSRYTSRCLSASRSLLQLFTTRARACRPFISSSGASSN